MPHCLICGDHYWSSPYNNTSNCDNCVDIIDDTYEEDCTSEIDLLLNPNGKTPVYRYDE